MHKFLYYLNLKQFLATAATLALVVPAAILPPAEAGTPESKKKWIRGGDYDMNAWAINTQDVEIKS